MVGGVPAQGLERGHQIRFGQQGTTTRMWAKRGSRPAAVKQTRYEWVYLYAAVEPATGHSVALQAPQVNTETMNVFLRMLSEELAADEHAILIMDQAGWHKSRRLKLPENITTLLLPPYSPELNPIERLWAYLRSHYLSNRVFDDYQHLLDAGAEAWQQLVPELLRSICSCTYLTHEEDR
ncbi:MAG: IS630 family transposase [Phycisphaeraceae bacterium]|nr:IS630 family transposase [Phycisphaeraceae bacterium]